MIRNNKPFRLFFFFLLIFCRLTAQSVDQSVLDRYDPSVVAKVFSIVKYVKVERPLQLQLAEVIHSFDSTITRWITDGKSMGSVDTLQQMEQFRLLGMLSTQQLQAYKYYSTHEISNAIATGEAEYIKKEYNPDSLTFNEIRHSLSNKYNYILQNFSDNYFLNHQAAIDRVRKLSEVYDEYKYFPMLYSAKYINGYLEKISTIKKIPEKSMAEIQHTFYDMVWKDNYADWSLAAKNSARLHYPDTALFSALYGPEYTQEAAAAFATERYDMIFKDHVSEEAFHHLEKLIEAKYYTEAVARDTYDQFYPQRYNQASMANMKYYDSLITATMIYDGSLQPTSQFAIALKIKDQLDLRPGLCDTLVHHAMYLEKKRDSIFLIDPFASIDFGDYETKYLSKLLTEDQYNAVLVQKNRTYAAANALADWREMVSRGIDRGFLKDQTVKELTAFYIAKNSAWCRYADDKIRQWANLRALDDIKPKALKVLDPLRWSGATEKTTNNQQLQW